MVAAHPGKRNGPAVADGILHTVHSDAHHTVAVGCLPFHIIILPGFHCGGLGKDRIIAAAVFGGINGVPFLRFRRRCFFFKYNADMVVLVNGVKGHTTSLAAAAQVVPDSAVH
ncbi:hypothetical protein SDC9_210177 [bioreactor metagenome]|uniref:Uncharacterized protein n=1 Tax=bioreactor metagenome TaxID=1076179 RepID=A0A645JIA7_9ZZZZ